MVERADGVGYHKGDRVDYRCRFGFKKILHKIIDSSGYGYSEIYHNSVKLQLVLHLKR